MSTVQPIGWSTSRMNMHFRSVFPDRLDTGMQMTLHRNVTKRLLPRELNLDENMRNVEMARRILHRQRLGTNIFVGGRAAPRQSLKDWKSQTRKRPETSPEMGEKQSSFLPQVLNYPSTPNTRYTADDVSKLVERLSSFPPEKVPESKGYPMKLPKTIVYKKKYSDDEIQRIVRRLTVDDITRHRPETRGTIPMVVSVKPRQTMSRIKKCSAEEVQDIVERLYKFDNSRHPPESRGSVGQWDQRMVEEEEE
ncbi:uncharacterized protein LOC132544842 [Ylistrum balloti]|uniref:uncharacterized protein LOC132544842 n=1 Tax=Ylistrum balloti TaxID=509963 RepID=UPI002905C231|nr:uncharacterized protein LOC132544842 [Ylistrum balloti]